ncbi:MAG: hypothetical protein JWN40_1223 [Phycisphaerales bacterium]|nr:hypothetical protein [Phycisphaerales bacterium]
MNTTVDPPTRGRAASAAGTTFRRANVRTPAVSPDPARRLRDAFAAVRVSFTWLGVRKSLSADQRQQAADGFGAEGQFLSAGKKLLDTRHAKYKAVTAVRGRVGGYWKSLSLPYPEPGLRLIRQADVEPFAAQMRRFKQELDDAVVELDGHYAELRDAARQRLGSLYDPADYPASLHGLFDVAWEFPSVEPPEYLLRLNPELYQQERQRMTARFDEAARLAEEAFTGEFARLVGHLVDRLTPGVDGQAKVFRDTAVGNLTEFFERFTALNVGSSAELEQLVETAQKAIGGAAPAAVRESSALRQTITGQLASVRAGLDQLLVDQPRRRILRQGRAAGGSS